MEEILDIIHKTIYQFFDTCGDNEKVPLSDKDKLLLEINKAVCNNLKALEQEPCKDAVSRNAIIQTLNNMDRYIANEMILCDTNIKFPQNYVTGQEVFIVDDVYEQIAEQLPSVTPQSKIGHWIATGNYFEGKYGYLDYFRCSCCHKNSLEKGRYCPNCKAKMI